MQTAQQNKTIYNVKMMQNNRLYFNIYISEASVIFSTKKTVS